MTIEEPSSPPPQVFISYAWGTSEHQALVLRLAEFLRVEIGIDVILDRWAENHRRDWSAWADKHLRTVDFILVIASPDYKRRADGEAAPDEGRGAQYEGSILRNLLMRDLSVETRRVLPVILPGGSVNDIPTFLCGHSTSHYRVNAFTRDGAESLLRALTGQPKHPLPPRGPYNPTPPHNDDTQADTTTPPVAQTDRATSHSTFSNTVPDRIVSPAQQHDPDMTSNVARHESAIGELGARGVSIIGGVHGTGSGITIGVVTGDHTTFNPPNPTSSPGRDTQDPR